LEFYIQDQLIDKFWSQGDFVEQTKRVYGGVERARNEKSEVGTPGEAESFLTIGHLKVVRSRNQ
jgi:hypothetical protein